MLCRRIQRGHVVVKLRTLCLGIPYRRSNMEWSRGVRDGSFFLVPYHRRLPRNVQFKGFRPVIGVVTEINIEALAI